MKIDHSPVTHTRTARQYLNDFIAVRAFEAGQVRVAHLPIEVHLQLTSTCDLDCLMCSEHNRQLSTPGSRRRQWLPREVFDKIAEEILPYSSRLVFGVGGEAMLSPDFFDYVRRGYELDQE